MIKIETIKIRQAVKKGYIEMESGMVACVDFPSSNLRRGRVQGEYGNICPTLTCASETICRITKERKEDMVSYRIRKLTPEECFVLMGMSMEDARKARNMGVSDSELYKQAGNGIVSNCIELIGERLFQNQFNKKIITTDMQYARKQNN